jgi:hypothetical protein
MSVTCVRGGGVNGVDHLHCCAFSISILSALPCGNGGVASCLDANDADGASAMVCNAHQTLVVRYNALVGCGTANRIVTLPVGILP